MRTGAKTFQMPTNDEIAVYAYHLWESEGRIGGRELDYWLQAKALLIAQREYEAGLLQTTPRPISSAQKAPALLTNGAAPKITRKRAARAGPDSIYA